MCYLVVQILRRRKNNAVLPIVIDRLSRLPRKLMPRMFKGFTEKQKKIKMSDFRVRLSDDFWALIYLSSFPNTINQEFHPTFTSKKDFALHY